MRWSRTVCRFPARDAELAARMTQAYLDGQVGAAFLVLG